MFEIILLVAIWIIGTLFISCALTALYVMFNGDKSEYDKLDNADNNIEDYEND